MNYLETGFTFIFSMLGAACGFLIVSIARKFYGRCRSSKKRKVTKKRKTTKACLCSFGGVYFVDIEFKKGVLERVRLAELVASTFMPEYKKGVVIKHKDGNRLNCSVGNLDLVFPSQFN